MAEDFFTQETRMARTAIKQLFKQTRARLEQHTDIRPLIRQRPWTSLLAGFSGGLVSGYLIAPRRKSAAEKSAAKAARARQPHHSARELLQEHLIASLTPAIGAFAASAAGALFHHQEHAGNDHQPAAVHENSRREPNPLSEP